MNLTDGAQGGHDPAAADSSCCLSTKGTIPFEGDKLEPEPENLCADEAGTGVGGISSGAGSLNTIIFEFDPIPSLFAAAASLFDFPGCLIVDPDIFLTSGEFSLILVFRVPSSFHSFVSSMRAAGSVDSASSPVGSTKICKRELVCEV